jgi:hypothetical protein
MQKLEINTHASSIKSAKPRRDWDSVEPLRTSRKVWKRHCTTVASACTPRLHAPPCRRQHRFHRQPPARSATSTAPVPSKTTAPMKRGDGKGQICSFPSGDGGSTWRRMRWGRRRWRVEGAEADGHGGRGGSSEGREAQAQGPPVGAWGASRGSAGRTRGGRTARLATLHLPVFLEY